ncbi:MAG TPA: SDR family oxidoreductase [Gemmatales bacterium]|nr:SDR family oxidoreductase [Gemmatales bacterium]
MSDKPLSGKTVLLTGGGSGIGAATARALVAEGARVVLTGRTEAKLAHVCAELGSSAAYRVCDGVDDQAVAQTVAWTMTHFGGQLDVLINNAGVNFPNRSLRTLTTTTWRQTLDGNLSSAFYFIQATLPHFTKQKQGLVIQVTSIAGLRASKLSGAAYCASKFGMQALSLCLGLEERDTGIRSTAIVPGEVDTPILDQRPEPVPPERRRLILHPEDVAAAVIFVCRLPARVSVPELVITPSSQPWA